MILNAEKLPIEGIDRLEITLNPELNYFINPEKRYIDSKNYLKVRPTYKFGTWWFLDIQAQFIFNYYYDIHACIANSILKLINNGFINFPCPINYSFIYCNLDFFVYEIRELEYYFDFEPEMINEININELNEYKGTLYSVDRRTYHNKPARKSMLEDYDHNERLNKVNQVPYQEIISNKYSKRIEFRLTKQNCPYRTLNNLRGTQHDVLMRYTPYMGILFHRYFSRNILINPKNHPYFSNILFLSKEEKERYRGPLEKRLPHKESQSEIDFYETMKKMKIIKSGYDVKQMLSYIFQSSYET